eukprot:COSAG05_NODE_1782_length_4096_cov_18.941206_3_plen_96_part_00
MDDYIATHPYHSAHTCGARALSLSLSLSVCVCVCVVSYCIAMTESRPVPTRVASCLYLASSSSSRRTLSAACSLALSRQPFFHAEYRLISLGQYR